MLFLPSPGDRFVVGATTFKLTVPRHPLSKAKVRSGRGFELSDTLVLEEAAFTAYYPADVLPQSAPRGIDWLLRPLSASLYGYHNYSGLSLWLLWPLIYFYGALIKIPVHPGAPLLDPHKITPTDTSNPSPWPLVIFSHGLGGSSTAYSQFCTRIASSGRVVLAMEHRDGSGHAATPSFSDPIIYTKETNLAWPPDHPADEWSMLSFRGEQLDFRRREIYRVLRAIRDLVYDGHKGSQDSLQSKNDTQIDWSSWFAVRSGKPIDCEDVVLAGHSFGGATVLSILSNAPPENETPMPIQKALILDPWLEPLPSPGPLPYHMFNGKQSPSIVVINSEKFTLWKDHFERLTEVGQAWPDDHWELLTIARSEHVSFSDFRVLPFLSSKAGRMILDKIIHLSLAFLDGNGSNSPIAGSSAKKMEVRVTGQRSDGRPKREIVGELCDVIRH